MRGGTWAKLVPLGLVRFPMTVEYPSYNVYWQLEIVASGMGEKFQSADLGSLT